MSKIFIRIAFGLLCLFGASTLIWFNEGRVDLSKEAEKSISIDAKSLNNAAEGKLVSVTGEITGSESLEDSPYLKNGSYLKIFRKVERFSWVEKTVKKTEQKQGSPSTTTTEYIYEKEWTNNPADSSTFKEPQHENRPLPIEEKTITVPAAKVGIYSINPVKIDFPPPSELFLDRENAFIHGNQQLQNNYIFIGEGSLEDPRIGDLRIHYTHIKAGQKGTLFGKLVKSAIEPYFDAKGNKLYRVFFQSREEAIELLHQEFLATKWFMRFSGFILSWIGFALILTPLSFAVNFLPILKTLEKGIIAAVTFIFAFLFSLMVTGISILLHSTIVFFSLLGACILTLLVIILRKNLLKE